MTKDVLKKAFEHGKRVGSYVVSNLPERYAPLTFESWYETEVVNKGIMDDNLELTLLEAIWLMRWNESKTSMAAVLTEEEALKMCKDIVEELNKAGYSIIPTQPKQQ